MICRIARQEAQDWIGQEVDVVIDRPIGHVHPKHEDILYPIPYGYVPGRIAGDNEEQDVYVLDGTADFQEGTVTIIAVVCRTDDVETKWVGVIDPSISYDTDTIRRLIHFQEQFYDSHVYRKQKA
jgi:inorganic pyrophosphatase